MGEKKVLLSHGSGGKLMHSFIKEMILSKFKNDILSELSDSASFSFLKKNFEVCFTTDSYVVNPIFFPGGDIGKLSICGTINDLSVSGAKPLYISCSFIIEEGFEYETFEKITNSMKKISEEEKVKIVTGDIKVVEKGKVDKIFINTSGIGIKDKSIKIGKKFIKAGDKVIINGSIGEHELAVISARGNFDFQSDIKSDCASLNSLISKILKVSSNVKFMRDPTRGGIATTLNEIVSEMDFGILIKEKEIPIKEEVKAVCEILGIDPLYLANEGKVVIIVNEKDAEKIIKVMKNHPLGKKATVIGEVVKEIKGKVIMETAIGTKRIIDMLVGEQFPRIC